MRKNTKRCPAPDCLEGDSLQPINNFTSDGGRLYPRCGPCRRKYGRERHRREMATNLMYYIKEVNRQKIYRLKKETGFIKEHHSIEYLGATPDVVLEHLRAKLPKGVTLEQTREEGWHLDHIIPRVAHNYVVPIEALIAEHYTNLQLLPAIDNLTKHDSLPENWEHDNYIAQKTIELGLI